MSLPVRRKLEFELIDIEVDTVDEPDVVDDAVVEDEVEDEVDTEPLTPRDQPIVNRGGAPWAPSKPSR